MMPKRPSKRKGSSKASEVLSPPKRPKEVCEETHFDGILSQIASQSSNDDPWARKDPDPMSDENQEEKEEFSFEPGLISDSSSDEEETILSSASAQGSSESVLQIVVKPSSTDGTDKRSKKRRLALQREAKRIEFLIHRVRFLSSLAHLLFIGRTLRESELLRALSLSLFPRAHAKASPSPVDVSSFLKWYAATASVFPTPYDEPITSRLEVALPKLEFTSQFDYTMGLYALALSIGWNVRLLHAPSEDPKNDDDNRHWCEIWTSGDQKWTTVDPVSGRCGAIVAKEIEKRLSPFWYVLAVCPLGSLKDVTPKYAQNYVTSVSKKRKPHEDWVQSSLRPYLPRSSSSSEDRELHRLVNEAPIPSTLSAMRGHPLYVTPKLLGKLEVIHPSSVKPVGTFRQGEPVYSRSAVHKLRSLISWQKEGMDVRKGERPRLTEKDNKTFWGSWQLERFVPPTAKEGKVPKNEFGNVEVYKPWMVPKGTVHIPISGISRLARKLDIDFAPAVTGWDYHNRGSHPVVDGIIVCTELQELLLDAWNNDEDAKTHKHFEKRQLRILSNWRKLTKGLILRERFKKKYKT